MVNEKQLICVPGQRLCLSDDKTIPGRGTYDKLGYIYASFAGVVEIKEVVEEKVNNLL